MNNLSSPRANTFALDHSAILEKKTIAVAADQVASENLFIYLFYIYCIFRFIRVCRPPRRYC